MSGHGDKPKSPTDAATRVDPVIELDTRRHRRHGRRAWLIMRSLTPEFSSEVEGRWRRPARLGLVLAGGGLFWLAVGLGVWWFAR